MPNIPREFINELLSRCDLVELIHARVPLKKKGNNHSACCPFHTEKTPSFTVSAVKQFYHCFGCGVSGNAISFLMEFDHLTFVEAIEELARQQGVSVPQQAGFVTSSAPKHDLYSLLQRVTRHYQQHLRHYPPAIEYLKQRGLTGEIAKEFLIGYAPDSWDSVLKQFGTSKEIITDLLSAGLLIKKNEGNYYDRFRDRIIFPIRDRRGRVIGFGGRIINTGEPKYLNSPETPIFHKGSELYGLYEACNAIRDLKRLIVVEGYMDTIALVQQGIKNVVATLGTATTADHLQRLFRIVPEIIFCFDGDKAGRAAAWRALEITLPLLQDGFHVRFLLLPEGEDPDSIVRVEGAEKFNERCDQAQLLADFFFQQLCAQINLTAAEGKAQLTKLAASLINKIPGVMLQHLLFERLANLVRIEVQALKQIALKPQTAVTKEKRSSKAKQATMRRTPMRLAIALLVQNPHLAQSVSYHSVLFDSQQPGSELLKELVNLLQEHTDMTVGLLLEYWRERAESELLQQLAAWDLGVPAEVVEQEFLGIIGKLVQLHYEHEIESLMQKANSNNLSDEEKEILKNLIKATKTS